MLIQIATFEVQLQQKKSIIFSFSFKMYIQNAAQWYNWNQYHVNKFLIRIKKTKNHILKRFSHTRDCEIKGIATDSENCTPMQLLKKL